MEHWYVSTKVEGHGKNTGGLCSLPKRKTFVRVFCVSIGQFIEELRDTDPRLQNAELDTAFHVAAKSSNPNIIIHLLATFRQIRMNYCALVSVHKYGFFMSCAECSCSTKYAQV